MARGRGRRAARPESASTVRVGDTRISVGHTDLPGTTGRLLVLLRENGEKSSGIRAMREAGFRVATVASLGAEAEALGDSDAVVFDQLGVAILKPPANRIQTLHAMVGDASGVLAVEPERYVYALERTSLMSARGVYGSSMNADYLRGYRDAVNTLVSRLTGEAGGAGDTVAPVLEAGFADGASTWGLQAIAVVSSKYTGKGIKVAVLDTGLDLQHPDLAGRKITSQSFVAGEEVQDRNGHGTHCIGVACGPQKPAQLPRYGVACDADIFAGKVLNNQGGGSDSGILAGLEWAITNRCDVVSMSLGAPVAPGQAYSRVFETVAQRALAAGTLIIAAAGNESHRPGIIAPVDHPANCPSIMAVGAVDAQLRVAYFSCGGLEPDGGQVDIVAPGVAIRSIWPRPVLYRDDSGTSMATPYVAGIAALFAEANPGVRGRALINLIVQHARRMTVIPRDVGAGLAQAPQQ